VGEDIDSGVLVCQMIGDRRYVVEFLPERVRLSVAAGAPAPTIHCSYLPMLGQS
jgi:hypothetical protein